MPWERPFRSLGRRNPNRLRGAVTFGDMKIAVSCDHAGFALKARAIEALREVGCEVIDLGTNAPSPPVDYPDSAAALGKAIQDGRAERGVLICGSGVGASVAASKLRGIRAAVCHDAYSAHQGVEHDDMNILCLGSEVVGPSLTRDLLATFLGARFNGGERYVNRLEQIEDIETAMSSG